MALPKTIEGREHQAFEVDLNDDVNKRVITGKTLKDLFLIINNDGFLAGETFDGFLCEENIISGFKTFHFFNQGEEIFGITLGFNSDNDLGALKISPSSTITRFFFVQGLNLGNEPLGSLMGVLFAIGGTNIIFTLLSNPNGYFEIINNNEVRSTTPIPEGEYKMFIKAEGQGGTQYVDEITINVFATALISNINLSSLVVETGALIGSIVGALSTSGGESPITYTVPAQVDINENPIDLFEINNNNLVIKANVGAVGTVYRVFIQAEDSRVLLPDDKRIKVEEFEISVVASSFANTNSLIFNGIDEILSIPNDVSLWGNQNLTVSAWVKPSIVGASQYIISKFREGGKRSWAMRLNTDGKLAVVYSQTGVASDTTTSTTLVDFNTWSHVAFVFDGTLLQPKMRLYINGVLEVDEDTALSSLFNNTDVNLIMGAINQPLPTVASDYFSGLIDEVSLFNTSLSSANITEIYNTGEPNDLKSNSSGSSLVSWWRMGDDFTGSVQPDSQSTNDADAINMNNSNKSTDVVTIVRIPLTTLTYTGTLELDIDATIGDELGIFSDDGNNNDAVYTITNDPDGFFQIVGDKLQYLTIPTIETVATLTVQANDIVGGSDSVIYNFTIPQEDTRSLSLNGVDECMEAPYVPAMDTNSSNLTMLTRFKVSATPNNEGRNFTLFSRSNGGNDRSIFAHLSSGSNRFSFGIQPTTGGHFAAGSIYQVLADVWVNAVMVITPTRMAIYIDGVLDNEILVGPADMLIPTGNVGIEMGCKLMGEHFEGLIFESALWNETLTNQQAIDLSNDSTLNPANFGTPFMYYRNGDAFYESGGSYFATDSISGNDATTTGMDLTNVVTDAP